MFDCPVCVVVPPPIPRASPTAPSLCLRTLEVCGSNGSLDSISILVAMQE